jgi:hypothetical protein
MTLLGYLACVWLVGSLIAGFSTVARIKRRRSAKLPGHPEAIPHW